MSSTPSSSSSSAAVSAAASAVTSPSSASSSTQKGTKRKSPLPTQRTSITASQQRSLPGKKKSAKSAHGKRDEDEEEEEQPEKKLKTGAAPAIPHVFRYFLLILPILPLRVYVVRFSSTASCKFGDIRQALRLEKYFLYCLCEVKSRRTSPSMHDSSAVVAAASSSSAIPAAAASSSSTSSSPVPPSTSLPLTNNLKDFRVILPYLFDWFRPADPNRSGNTGHQEFHKDNGYEVIKASVGGNQTNVVPHEHCFDFFQEEKEWKQYLQKVYEEDFKDVREHIRLMHDFLKQYVKDGEILNAPLHEIEIRDVTQEDKQFTSDKLKSNMKRIHAINCGERNPHSLSLPRTDIEPYRLMNFRKNMTADFTLTMAEGDQQVPIAILRPRSIISQATRGSNDNNVNEANNESPVSKHQKNTSNRIEHPASSDYSASSTSMTRAPSSNSKQPSKPVIEPSSTAAAATTSSTSSSASKVATSRFDISQLTTGRCHQEDDNRIEMNQHLINPWNEDCNAANAAESSIFEGNPFDSSDSLDDDSSSSSSTSIVSQRLATVKLPPDVPLDDDNSEMQLNDELTN